MDDVEQGAFLDKLLELKPHEIWTLLDVYEDMVLVMEDKRLKIKYRLQEESAKPGQTVKKKFVRVFGEVHLAE